jgi:hypothetical protein
LTTDFEVLDVHHHVGNAFRALGGADDATPELDESEFERIELASRLEIMDQAAVQQAIVIPGHGYHRPNGIADTRAEKLAVVARTIPETPVLALDGFGSYEATRECFFIAEVAPNIVFDTSLSYNFDFIEDFANRFGPDRVVFGTDLYSHPVDPRRQRPPALRTRLTGAERSSVF